jgi:hypothetical protein
MAQQAHAHCYRAPALQPLLRGPHDRDPCTCYHATQAYSRRAVLRAAYISSRVAEALVRQAGVGGAGGGSRSSTLGGRGGANGGGEAAMAAAEAALPALAAELTDKVCVCV